MEKRGPDSDAETLEFFAELLDKFSKTREDVKTWFEVGELHDYVSFGGKAYIPHLLNNNEVQKGQNI
jgi:hypothetical protein